MPISEFGKFVIAYSGAKQIVEVVQEPPSLSPAERELLEHRSTDHNDPDPAFEKFYDCAVCGLLERRVYRESTAHNHNEEGNNE